MHFHPKRHFGVLSPILSQLQNVSANETPEELDPSGPQIPGGGDLLARWGTVQGEGGKGPHRKPRLSPSIKSCSAVEPPPKNRDCGCLLDQSWKSLHARNDVPNGTQRRPDTHRIRHQRWSAVTLKNVPSHRSRAVPRLQIPMTFTHICCPPELPKSSRDERETPHPQTYLRHVG